MATNRIPVSVRISQEDADFIAQLQIEGATTPSEKIRELLTQARLAIDSPKSYDTMLRQMEDLLSVARYEVLQREKELGVHSHILARVFESMPDLIATLSAGGLNNASHADLCHYEKEVMWRVVRVMESILQLAVVGKGAGYDDTILNELDNTLTLARIINEHREHKEQP